jgi:hypothetical protein
MDKIIEISSVHDAEIRPPKRGDTSGCIITFISDENVVKNDKVLITCKDNNNHYFDVVGIKITEDKKLRVEAKEVGYFNKFEKQKDFDLREIIGLSVSKITDPELLRKIYEESCYC